MKRVVITGIGAITPIGNNVAAYLDGLQNGVSPASQSEIALYTIQSASYVEAVQLLKRRGLEVDVSTVSSSGGASHACSI